MGGPLKESNFKAGDYVRLVEAPANRMGTLMSDPNSAGVFQFRYDIRLTDRPIDTFVSKDEIEHCTRPTDEEARAINSARKLMEQIVVHSRKHREGGRIEVEVDTPQGGTSAWRKDFGNPNDILELFRKIAPEEIQEVRDFVTKTVNSGEDRIILSCNEMEFSKHGFEKLPRA
jgi:hypothetical protein